MNKTCFNPEAQARKLRRCTFCDEFSVKKLRISLCQYHYTEYMWGTKWANSIYKQGSK